MTTRTGIGYDSHRLEAGRKLVLGGVEVPGAACGLSGHSDADVLTHAAIDALLGAAGMGDVGQHFPDTEERWRDADSIVLLEEVALMLRRAGVVPVHVDASVIAEAPKLSPHRGAMRDRLAAALGVDAVGDQRQVHHERGHGLRGSRRGNGGDGGGHDGG
ncbi:MAG: 2-C-methyl-D-erythritol 2,4-cyclodiphosphate synthase [Thermoleophilaceae bacterium]